MNIHELVRLALRHYESGNLEEAKRFLQMAHKKKPDAAEISYLLGIIYAQLGNYDPAEQHIRESLRFNPSNDESYLALGLIMQQKGLTGDAIDCFKTSISLNPGNAEAHKNLASALMEEGQFDEAITYLQNAVRLIPDLVLAHCNLGRVFLIKGQVEEAIACYQKALQMRPEYADAYCGMGVALQEKGRLDEAVSYFQKALQFNPNLTDALNELGRVSYIKGRFDEAEAYYRRALQLKPDFQLCYSNLLLMMNYSSRYTPEAVFTEHLRFAKQIAEPLASAILPHTNDRSPSRRLRIGYVSPDFRRHSVNYFLEPVLSSHDHEHFEIFCYSDVVDPDTVTKSLQGYADKWRDIRGMPDKKGAELIRKDGIDILIDLAGHTGYNRMLLFARKPAPVQVSWIGYPNTTGLSTVDYRIVDGHTDPPGLTDPFYTEKLIRMPECFLCYQPDKDSPDVAAPPCLTSGYITFGSFNNFAKETPDVLALWAEILQRIPGSRLILKSQSFSYRETSNYVREIFASHGIDSGRIELLDHKASFSEHLRLYNRVDIGLDPFPYNGTTTTCEALWMGAPVITFSGDVHASRVSTSLLSNVGLEGLIARTYEEYIGKAVDLAGDTKRLQSLREGLRSMMRQSPLTDAKKFTFHLENCYRTFWENWCKLK